MTKNETVNHPSHYGGDTVYETIKVLKAWLTPEEYVGFLKGNSIKYLSRHRQKNGAEDLRKALWYDTELAAFVKDHPEYAENAKPPKQWWWFNDGGETDNLDELVVDIPAYEAIAVHSNLWPFTVWYARVPCEDDSDIIEKFHTEAQAVTYINDRQYPPPKPTKKRKARR